jgi:hypothetical protein
MISQYSQQIELALSCKARGQGLIHYRELVAFFRKIELEEKYIEYIVTQTCMYSECLSRLNYHSMLDIFSLAPAPH